MAVTLYKSTDSNAPVLMGQAGSLVNLLDACLVTGYGGVRATVTITSNGTSVSNNDTITIDGVTYTWKTALTPAANEILIGASAATNLSNLVAALMGYGVAGTNYGTGTTLANTYYVSSITSTVITLTAYVGGTGGNSLAISKSAANITLGGATFSGGSGSVTTTAAGWAKPYSGVCKAVFRAASGVRHYLDVDDSSPGAGLSKEARTRGYESMTAVATGTNPFPTVAQLTAGPIIRKSAAGDAVSRVWKLFANDRSFHLLTQSADVANAWHHFFFGDIYSFLTGDSYKTLIMGRPAENSTSDSTTNGAPGFIGHYSAALSALSGHYMSRGYTGLGASVNVGKIGDSAANTSSGGTTPIAMYGHLGYPNGADGGLYIAPVRIVDPSTSPAPNIRGLVPGLFHYCHPISNVADGDIFSGATGSEYDGRSFHVMKHTGGSTGVCVIETTDWPVSA